MTKSAPYKVSEENRARQSGTCEAETTAGYDEVDGAPRGIEVP